MDNNNELDGFLDEIKFLRRNTIYKCSLNAYFKTINITPINYSKSGRDFEKDIIYYLKSNIPNYKRRTIQSYTGCIEAMLRYYDVELSAKYERERDRVINTYDNDRFRDHSITVDEIREIISHMTLRDKAITLFLVSSGMRIGELLKLKINDINMDKEPAEIIIPSMITKSKTSRVTFISNEAKTELKRWLKHREEYIRRNLVRVVNKKYYNRYKHTERIFPVLYKTYLKKFRMACMSSGITGYSDTFKKWTTHPHSIRKFYISKMETAMPRSIVNYLVGHQDYLDGSYKRYGTEELSEFYRKAEGHVTINRLVDDVDPEKLQEADLDMLRKQYYNIQQLLKLK